MAPGTRVAQPADRGESLRVEQKDRDPRTHRDSDGWQWPLGKRSRLGTYGRT